MARLGRYFIEGQALHVIQRGNNRKAVFFTDEDRVRYREWLTEAAGENGLKVHAYVLMTNHVHLLVTPAAAKSLPATMQSLGRRYVRHINLRYRRSGTLWEGRYRAHAEAKDDPLAQFHDSFRRLGRSLDERQSAWRALIREKLDPAFVAALRAATNGGWAMGGVRFRKEIEAAARRRAAPLPPGPKPAAGHDTRQMRLL